MKKKPEDDSLHHVSEQLDEVVRLLQDLFILEAAKVKMNNDEIRELLGVRMARVSDIAKHIE